MSNEYAGVHEIIGGYQMQQVYWEIDEYDEKEDLNDYNVVVNRQGMPYYVNSMMPVYSTKGKQSKGVYVVTLDGTLRMAYRLHHSDLMHGQPIQCGGEFKLSTKGTIKYINNQSGHYLPAHDCLDDVITLIRQNGYAKSIVVDEIDRHGNVTRRA